MLARIAELQGTIQAVREGQERMLARLSASSECGLTKHEGAAGEGYNTSISRMNELEERNAALVQEVKELRARLTSPSSGADDSEPKNEGPIEPRPPPTSGELKGSEADQEIEMFLRSLKLEQAIVSQLPAGTTLTDFVHMTPAQIATVLHKAAPAMQQKVAFAQQKAQLVQEANGANGKQGKFLAQLKGGVLEDFLHGVTGIVNEPHADLEKGMMEEHTERPDSHVMFSTGNSGLTTYPALEYELVASGGSMLARKRVDGSEECVVVTGTRGCCKDGQVCEDLRVLRTLDYFGNFGQDGRLAFVEGDEVVVCEKFLPVVVDKGEDDSDEEDDANAVEGEDLSREDAEKRALRKQVRVLQAGDSRATLQKAEVGTVLKFNAAGAAKIKFGEVVGVRWVSRDQFSFLHPLPNMKDTKIQSTVKMARLRRVEVKAIILYTGPCFTLYNAILRGFGSCGEVAAGIEFGTEEFWEQIGKVSIDAWVALSGHRFASTIHALASAIKKLQGLSQDPQGTRLWRGLGGLDVREFIAGLGITDKAFMSTTRDQRTALEYSGVQKGLVGTVLCIETSTTNNGADITAFSQYPGEAETVWNACCFIQNLKGREEVVLPEGGGIVKVFHVLCSANSKAETVEELEGHRKRVVESVLDTLHADVCRFTDAAASSAEFQARVADDWQAVWKDDFLSSIKDESAARVAVYKALHAGVYASNEKLGEAIFEGLSLPLRAEAKYRLYLEDLELNLGDLGNTSYHGYIGFSAAQGRRLAQRRRLLLQDSTAGVKDKTALALVDCYERRLITGARVETLERKDAISGETPLIQQVQIGDIENSRLLLQAGADANATTIGGQSSLQIAARVGRDDIVALLVNYKAQVDCRNANGKTALHWASQSGHLAAVHVLLKCGANISAVDGYMETSLHKASEAGWHAVVQTLLEHGADVSAIDERERISLHWACIQGHRAVVQTLLAHGANVAAIDEDGRSPLDLARANIEKKEAEMMAAVETVLREYGAKEQRGGKHSLRSAAEKGILEEVVARIKEGADVNERNRDGQTAIELVKANYLRLDAQKIAAVEAVLREHGATEQ